MNEDVGNYKYIAVSCDFFIRMLRNDTLLDKVVNPLPKDAKFIRGGNDSMGNMYLIIESKEFPLLKEGEEIPFYGHILFQKANVGGMAN